MSTEKKKFYKCKACYASGAFCAHQKKSAGKSSGNGGGGKRKFFKCKVCYEKGGFCTHQKKSVKGGSPSKVKVKKTPDAVKVDVPVLDAEVCGSVWVVDGADV